MTPLRIPPEQRPEPSHGTPVRGASTALRTGWRWAGRALIGCALLLFAVLVLLPALGLYRPVTVLSGSMRPTFSPGDVVLDVPEPISAVRVGQVVSYHVPVGIHQVETHRVVSITGPASEPTIQTRGDANNHNDPWTAKLEGKTAWRQVAVIPKLGYLINAMRSSTLHLLAVIIAPLLLALLFLAQIWGVGSNERRKERRVGALDRRQERTERRQTPRIGAQPATEGVSA